MLVRKDYMRASKAMQHRVTATPNIDLRYNTEVDEVLGDMVVEGLRMKNNKDWHHSRYCHYRTLYCYWAQAKYRYF